jgi:hypothetical protein
MEPRLRINTPSVVAEIIDGEAVIMELATGHYFSTQGVGAEIWRGVESELTRSAILALLLDRYDAPRDVLEPALDSFLADLRARGLVVEANGEPAPVSNGTGSGLPDRKDDFAAPVLNAYTDMQDLLLLDPIHDVDEAGWPMPKSADA